MGRLEASLTRRNDSSQKPQRAKCKPVAAARPTSDIPDQFRRRRLGLHAQEQRLSEQGDNYECPSLLSGQRRSLQMEKLNDSHVPSNQIPPREHNGPSLYKSLPSSGVCTSVVKY